MHTKNGLFTMLLLAAVGCSEAGGSPGVLDPGTTGEEDPLATGEATAGSNEDALTGDSTGGGFDPTDGGPTGETGELPETSETGDDSAGLVFDETPPEDKDRIDRVGFPGVSAFLVGGSMDQAYNEGSPADDEAFVFVNEVFGQIGNLHVLLDDDILAGGGIPCDLMDCVNSMAPQIIPDVISVELSAERAFPNGRAPGDPVVDIVLTAILAGETGVLNDLPLNPVANDVPLPMEFPYLAPAH